MCQPSASTAMELNHQPPAISTTIITRVSAIARRVFFSAIGLPWLNAWLCWRERARVSGFMA